MKKKSKKISSLVVIAAATLVLMGAAVTYTLGWESDPIVATVNGEPVVFSELTMVMGKFRAQTAAYFYSQHGLDFGAGFWETEIDGTTPLEYCKGLALDHIAERKVQQQFLREQGIIRDFSHKAFMREFGENNRSRDKTTDQGGAVYGVAQIAAVNYYDYVLLNQIQSFFDSKADLLFSITDNDLTEFYERNIENFRRDNGTLKPMDESESAILSEVRWERYEAHIKKLMASVDVRIRNREFSKLVMD